MPNHDGAKELQVKSKNGYLNCQSGNVMPLFSSIVEHNEIGFQKCFMIEQCPFCGLGFSHVWVGRLVFYKHLYHYCCAITHFNISSKCIRRNCEEELHNAWWSYIKITKPEMIVVAKLTLRTLKPKFPK